MRPVWKMLVNGEHSKRIMDVLVALFALIIFSPILILSAAAIRLGGSHSVFFRQARIGRNNKPFLMLKFTTMHDDAHVNGLLISTAKDSRVTKVGKIVRDFGINELPQLVNVLRGEMSIVGPRPEVRKYVDLWSPELKEQILSVRPGITGTGTLRFWHEGALLDGKSDVERAYIEEILPEKLRIELWYVTNRTQWLDIRIMFITLLKALGGSRLFRSASREESLTLEERS